MPTKLRAPISRPNIAAVDLVPRPPVRMIGGEIEGAAMDPRTRRFWEFCAALPRENGLPHRSSAGAEVLRSWLGNLMILDPVEGGQDFRYRLYGSEIARYCGFDMTTRLVSSFSSKTGTFFLESYKTCLSAAEPVLTQNVAEHASGMVLWESVGSLPHAAQRVADRRYQLSKSDSQQNRLRSPTSDLKSPWESIVAYQPYPPTKLAAKRPQY